MTILWAVLIGLAILFLLRNVSRVLKALLTFGVLVVIAVVIVYTVSGSVLDMAQERVKGEWVRGVGEVPFYDEVSWWLKDVWYEITIRFR